MQRIIYLTFVLMKIVFITSVGVHLHIEQRFSRETEILSELFEPLERLFPIYGSPLLYLYLYDREKKCVLDFYTTTVECAVLR